MEEYMVVHKSPKLLSRNNLFISVCFLGIYQLSRLVTPLAVKLWFFSSEFCRSVRRPSQYQEKSNRTMILAPLVGIITSLMDAHSDSEHKDLNDVVGVFANMDCPATVFQCLLGYNWVRCFYLASIIARTWLINLIECLY